MISLKDGLEYSQQQTSVGSPQDHCLIPILIQKSESGSSANFIWFVSCGSLLRFDSSSSFLSAANYCDAVMEWIEI